MPRRDWKRGAERHGVAGAKRRAASLPAPGRSAPAQRREPRARGRRTRRRFLEAGRVALAEHGFHALRVDDVARAAGTSHGTFYLYFSGKEDLLAALVQDALHDMEAVVRAFPAVSLCDNGKAALRSWVGRFGDTYATHAAPLRVLSQADGTDPDLQSSGLRLLWRLAEAIAHGMTTAGGPGGQPGGHTEFTALACAMMLERLNYLLSVGVAVPKRELADRVTAITAAAFSSEPAPADLSRAQAGAGA